MLVMCDEIIAMVKRILRGLEVNTETLAVEVIDAVGPGGNFLGEDHTVRLFRRECHFPTLADRSNFENWTARGATTLGQRAEERVREILATYQPKPLPETVKAQFEQVLAADVARAQRENN